MNWKLGVSWVLVIGVVVALAGCGGSANQKVETAPPGEVLEKTIVVGPLKILCVGMGPQECLLIKESPRDPWRAYYSEIDGFYYEEGFIYQLRVAAVRRDNPPADASAFTYQMLEQISKNVDTYGGAGVIEDLLTNRTWRLDAFTDGSFEEAAMLSPEVTLEFTRDGAMRGAAGCNQYFGEYRIQQNKALLVSGVGATRMSCPEESVNQQETRYLEALEKTVRIDVGLNVLRLYYGLDDRALYFKAR
jgi:heat shock protein HslJ